MRGPIRFNQLKMGEMKTRKYRWRTSSWWCWLLMMFMVVEGQVLRTFIPLHSSDFCFFLVNNKIPIKLKNSSFKQRTQKGLLIEKSPNTKEIGNLNLGIRMYIHTYVLQSQSCTILFMMIYKGGACLHRGDTFLWEMHSL